MTEYRRRPTPVKAMRYTGDVGEVKAFTGRRLTSVREVGVGGRLCVFDDALQDEVPLDVGDWIVREDDMVFTVDRSSFEEKFTVDDPLDHVHLIEFTDSGWTIMHPLEERMGGPDVVFECPMTWSEYTDLRGRYVLNSDGTPGELVKPTPPRGPIKWAKT